MKPRRSQSGFTLLELLVALAMSAVLALVLYTSLRIGFRARDGAVATLRPVRAASVAMEMLRKDLENAMPVSVAVAPDDSGQYSEMFIGQSNPQGDGRMDQIEFYSPDLGKDSNIDPTVTAGLRKIDLVVEPDPNGKPALVRRTWRNILPVDQTQIVDPQEEVVARNVKSFMAQYLDTSTGQPVWDDDWDSAQMGEVLPQAVMITLDLVIPAERPGQQDRIYHMARIIPIACHKDPSTTSTTGSNGTVTGGIR